MQDLTILYVEDEDGIRESLAEFIKNFADNVFVAKDGKEGLEVFLKEEIDLVISDIRMPIMTGIEMVHQIKRINPKLPVIFTTAHSESEYMAEAIDMQVDGYILKPIDFDKLENKLNHLIEIMNLQYELSLHKVSHFTMNAKDTLFVALGSEQNILYANKDFLSFFNIENIDEFFHKYEFFHSIFIKEDGCFYPREHESWINDFRRIENNDRRFIALFDEINDSLQLFVGHIYNADDSLSVNISFKKVDSLDHFNNKNNANISMECTTLSSKNSVKGFFKKQLKKNKKSSIKVINITANSDNTELLEKLSRNILKNIRHTNLLQRCDINDFGFLIIDVSPENITKLVNRLEKNLFNESIKGEIQVINIDSEETIDTLFGTNAK